MLSENPALNLQHLFAGEGMGKKSGRARQHVLIIPAMLSRPGYSEGLAYCRWAF